MFLSVENISTLTSNKFISEQDFQRDFEVYPEAGDILMTRIGDIGTPNIVRDNHPKAFYVSLALLKHKNLNPEFLNASILSPQVQKELSLRTLHTATPKKINKNEIGESLIYFPLDGREQQQIGSFFQRIDETITLHQRVYLLILKI